MINYLREHSAGSIIRSAFDIYGKNFLSLTMIYFIPVFPVTAFQQEAQLANNVPLLIVAIALSLFVNIFAYAATAVAISDICLGNKPGFTRAYATVFGAVVGKLFLTNLLTVPVLMLGFLLLIVPGIIFSLWFFFAPLVVLLERRWGWAALKRSKELGKGFYLRNLGVIVVMALLGVVIVGIVGGVFGAAFPELLDHWIFRTLLVAVQAGLSVPLIFISLVLLYYDMRVRKESYDSATLAEELRH